MFEISLSLYSMTTNIIIKNVLVVQSGTNLKGILIMRILDQKLFQHVVIFLTYWVGVNTKITI